MGSHLQRGHLVLRQGQPPCHGDVPAAGRPPHFVVLTLHPGVKRYYPSCKRTLVRQGTLGRHSSSPSTPLPDSATGIKHRRRLPPGRGRRGRVATRGGVAAHRRKAAAGRRRGRSPPYEREPRTRGRDQSVRAAPIDPGVVLAGWHERGEVPNRWASPWSGCPNLGLLYVATRAWGRMDENMA